MFKSIGRALLGALYAITPIFGWIPLFKSFKWLRPGEISVVLNYGGEAEVISEPGIYFRPFPGDIFGATYQQTTPFIDFGPIKRVFVPVNHKAVKMNASGQFVELKPGYNIIGINETYQPSWLVDTTKDDYTLGQTRFVTIKAGEIGYCINNHDGSFQLLEAGKHELPAGVEFKDKASMKKDIIDFGNYKIVRIREGFLGVKTTADGGYEVLNPGIHIIDASKKETFNEATGIQNISKDDFTLGNIRHVRIRNGELGESYQQGKFVLLEPGEHQLKPNHIFVKKVSVNRDVVDLGALKIVTVKQGQVAIINTPTGVDTKGPGKYNIKQEEGNFFNSILTTSLQGLTLAPLKVMCSDQIEMEANSMLMFTVSEPLKTVGLGIEKILSTLTSYADGILRSILSRFSSSDISPSLHVDEEHPSAERTAKLKEVHDDFVQALNEKANNWGLEISDLQITSILPADPKYLETLQKIGTQQVQFEVSKAIASSEAEIAKIRATAETSMKIAATNEQAAAVVKAETEAQTIKIKTQAETARTVALAEAEAKSIELKSNANSARVTQLNRAMQGASETTQKIMLIEADGAVKANVLRQVKNPVFIQPNLGETSVLTKGPQGMTLFSTKRGGSSSLVDALALEVGGRVLEGRMGGHAESKAV